MSTLFSELARGGTVTNCSFDFLKRSKLYDTEKPYYFSGALEPEQEKQRSNLEYTTHNDIELIDLRGRERQLRLETHGFELLRHNPEANLHEPTDDDLEGYLEEIAAVVKERLSAELVLAYNFRVSSESC